MSHSLALLCTGYLGPSAVPFADRDLALALQCSVLQDAQLIRVRVSRPVRTQAARQVAHWLSTSAARLFPKMSGSNRFRLVASIFSKHPLARAGREHTVTVSP